MDSWETQRESAKATIAEIKNKIALFDARLTLLVGQGRISPSAASELAAYLQRLSPA